MINDQPTLDYSLAPPRRRQWRIVIICVIAGVAAFVLVPRVMRLRDRIARRSPFLAVQRQCMNVSFPPDQVVYEEDQQRAQRLADSKPPIPGASGVGDGKGKVLAFYRKPDLINQYIDWDASGVVLSPFTDFLFLHGRQAKGGPQRLVHIGLHQGFDHRALSDSGLAPGTAEEQKVLDWEVIRPGTLFSTAANIASGSWSNKVLYINMPKPLRIYAGQADPSDASHFTFDALTPGGTLLIDGWIQANDQIVFSVK